ncbi:bifunctional adenosylcobinamide kinase/adenosylcobinamide-phosphate guanylyltransferase [Sporomusa acidovorans]|uniref:Adenosylcobinamide kinase n=1 Tax=Sporomusa acidovorans (strain ATCC 49682 / DSM 3132 / Mol) TaxID=1123286 RepID=A0ABZ3J1M7_SPOA4|nr:bifunctional adenosylcobinamide kinase/adenosylcobinamide-phosphate guanylyltransferase [Sporomusa acidovorans]OZC15057.1 bifunctional adenosylcobalamin biosynthesis protein CobP [Sporomusa acidovorans DSM 3132]SDE84793.1 adenosylcobinamide kinase /adenosylcobinamide-phosphate guanylyltransferase [Sporomusa acidovorans]
MAGKIVLVTGGARSGKSTFAEEYAAKNGLRVAYIATAQIYDDEMRERVNLHQSRRPANWKTFEAPYRADEAMRQAVREADIVLFDCLTLYTSNLLLAPDAPQNREERRQVVLGSMDKLLASAKEGDGDVIFVTNEVGLGIVPDNALAREYRDIAGLVNQKVAANADEVYLVVCGLAVELKK